MKYEKTAPQLESWHEFLARALEMNVPGDHLERALKKRLFAIQLDAVYEQLPKLRKFQWRDHEQLVREFQ